MPTGKKQNRSAVGLQISIRPVLDEIQARLPLSTSSRRLFHGRGQCFPGYEELQVDWFSPALLLTVYRPYPEEWLTELCAEICKLSEAIKVVYLQERQRLATSTRLFRGEPIAAAAAEESGLRYRLRLGAAQNIGFFLDMAAGRKLVSQLAAKKRVLNLFAYTCSFSVAALAAGAAQVVNLDMNRGALELGKLNHQLNGIDLRRVSFLPIELFRSIGKLRKLAPFDLIICDPPATQGRSFRARRDWAKLLRKIGPLLAPRGTVVACLNAPSLPPEFLMELFAEELPQAALQQTLTPGEDFPELRSECGVWIFHYRFEA